MKYNLIVIILSCVAIVSCFNMNNHHMAKNEQDIISFKDFIKDDSLCELLEKAMVDTNGFDGRDINKITLMVEMDQISINVHFFKMGTFGFPTNKMEYVGGLELPRNLVLLFCNDDIPSFIDTTYFSRSKGMEYIGEESLLYTWGAPEAIGYSKTYCCLKSEMCWSVVDERRIREAK